MKEHLKDNTLALWVFFFLSCEILFLAPEGTRVMPGSQQLIQTGLAQGSEKTQEH